MAQQQKPGQFAAKVEQSLGIVPGTKLWSPFPFAGLNLQDTPPAIDDKEFSYIENFFRLGNGYLRAAWDAGAAFYTAPVGKTLLPYFFFYNIANVDYLIAFFTDGTANQVQLSNSAVTAVTTATNTFYKIGVGLPICSQWGTKYIVIANNFQESCYFIWDGANLYQAGTAGPEVNLISGGSNYNALPTVVAFNGAGSGVTVTPTIENGSVTTNVIATPGSGYALGDTVQLQYSGGGSDTGAVLLANLGNGSVSSAQVTAGGSGYGSPPGVTFSPPSGVTATGTANESGGYVNSINLTNPGAGYTSPPTIMFSGGGGSGAAANATIQNGSVVSVTFTDHGHGYTSAPTVTFSAPTGAIAAQGTAFVSGGAVTEIVVSNPGSGYTSPPTISFSGPGVGATATAYLSSGGITGVNVVNGGTNFTSPPVLSFQGGNGVGAVAQAILTPTTISHINVTSGGGNVANGGGGYTSAPTVVFNNSGTDGTAAAATAIISNGAVVAITLSNAGTGYTIPPLITFTGGGLPTGAPSATAEAILVGTSIASVIMSNQGTGYTQAPAVIVAPGSNNAAQALLNMMPFGVSGNDIETFNSRVWISYPFQKTTIPTGGDFETSAPGSATDFATSDGGNLFVNSDRFLRKQYTGLRQSNGYLYLFGDSSASVVSNVQTTGNPATTTFTYQNADPQIGAAWRDTLQDFSKTIISANETGVYGLFGGSMTKLSAKLDQLFVNAVFPPTIGALTPSAAVATINNVRHYMLYLTVRDPVTNAVRNAFLCWNEQGWVIASQTPSLQFICTQEIDSKLMAWGCDTQSIYPLFAQSSSTLIKRLNTKYYGTEELLFLKDFVGLYLQAQDLSGGSGINMSVNMVVSGIAVQPADADYQSVANAQFNSSNYPAVLFQQPAFNAVPPFFPVFGNGSGGFSFSTLGVQFTTQSPDFAISNLLIAYLLNTAYQ